MFKCEHRFWYWFHQQKIDIFSIYLCIHASHPSSVISLLSSKVLSMVLDLKNFLSMFVDFCDCLFWVEIVCSLLFKGHLHRGESRGRTRKFTLIYNRPLIRWTRYPLIYASKAALVSRGRNWSSNRRYDLASGTPLQRSEAVILMHTRLALTVKPGFYGVVICEMASRTVCALTLCL